MTRSAHEHDSCGLGAWDPGSWRGHPVSQQPAWPDAAALTRAVNELERMPPLVFAGESRRLRERLAAVAAGRGFLLQVGDCAESFEALSADAIRDKLRVLLQMAAVLTYGAGVPVVKVGRIAGQFAKPRSAPTETRQGVTLPSYRGDLVNDVAFTDTARVPDPTRMVRAYHQSASTLNLVRAFSRGGFADLSQIHTWNQEFVRSSPEGERFEHLAAGIDRALRFMAACGVDTATTPALHEAEVYTSHEALVLDYEQALTRVDSLTGTWYDCSTHLPWIGERTRQVDGAHVEFLSGVANPVGVKVGPDADPYDVVALCQRLDPAREPGRLVLITRMGAERITEALGPVVEAVAESGHPVVWVCDPMHANTFTHASGFKTRHFDDIARELEGFFAVCRARGVWPGGMHLELTGHDVTECLGGADALTGDDLEQRYETMCDPRLNARQGLELAFRASELLTGP